MVSQKIDCYFIVKIEIFILLDRIKFPFLKLNPDIHRNIGFSIYKIESGALSTPHRQVGAEGIYVIEGELKDNNGTLYPACNVLLLALGT